MNTEKIIELKQKFERNELGLISSINYIFNEDNTINWRKMIKSEFLVANRDSLKKKKIDPETVKISELEDKDLLILLGGIKELAQIRGFKSVTYPQVLITDQYVCAVCRIKWTPNYETNFQPVTFEAIADAHIENTTDFGSIHLAAMAENRAFVRCVRNFLKINIVGQEETTQEDINFVTHNPTDFFTNLLKKNKISFLKVKKVLIANNIKNAEKFKKVKDIPPSVMMEYVSKIKNGEIK